MAELDKSQQGVAVPGDWTYASAPESRDIVEIRERYGHFVGGEWLEPAETYETIAPRDEEPLGIERNANLSLHPADSRNLGDPAHTLKLASDCIVDEPG